MKKILASGTWNPPTGKIVYDPHKTVYINAKTPDYTSELLNIMYHQDEMTTSDLQGTIEAIVNRIIGDTAKRKIG
jgi:hypothetical protein